MKEFGNKALGFIGTVALIILVKFVIGAGKIAYFTATYDEQEDGYYTVVLENDDFFEAEIEPWPLQPGQGATIISYWGGGTVMYRQKDTNGEVSEWKTLNVSYEADEDGSYTLHEVATSFESGENEIELKVVHRDKGAQEKLGTWHVNL